METENPRMVEEEQNWLKKMFAQQGGQSPGAQGAAMSGGMGGMGGGAGGGATQMIGGLASGLGSAISGGPTSSEYNSGALDSIPAGTFTSMGAMAGPYGLAAGAAADIGLAAFTGNRKAKKKAIKEKEAKVDRLYGKAWETAAQAGLNRTQMEQDAISRMFNIGR